MPRLSRPLLLTFALLALFGFGGGWMSSWAIQRARVSLPFIDAPLIAPSTAASIGEEGTDMTLFWEAMALLDENYYSPDELPRGSELTYAAIDGVVAATEDPHTGFMDPEAASAMAEQLNGEFQGIGTEVDMSDEGLVIVSPYPESPAEKAGLKPADLVLEVDGVPTKGMTAQEASSRVRGPAGTTVRLLIHREGVENFEVEITRARIVIPIVESHLIEPEGGPRIGYIRLYDFGGRASEQFKTSLQGLLDQGAESIIFDLRNNPGGYLTAAVDITSQFVDKGLVLSEKGSNGRDIQHPAEAEGIALDIPLVVLVNEGSASASEIVAGALQDDKRATLIGVTTFGKGSVQVTHNLSDGSSIRVTIARWFTPSGRAIHEVGIEPDVRIEQPADAPEGSDAQLDAAVKYLQENR